MRLRLLLVATMLFAVNLCAQDSMAVSTIDKSTGVKTLVADSATPPPTVSTSVPIAEVPKPVSITQKHSKPNVAVLEFSGSFKIFTREDIQAITNRFETELMKTDSFTVLERRNMDAILQEQGFQQTGVCNSAECQVHVGQLLGVDRIITGEVSKMGDIISLNLKMVDVEKGNNTLSHVIDIKGELQDVLRGGCYEMAQIFSGKKKPESDRTILTAEKSNAWPWILGGVGLVAIGAGTYIVLNSGSSKRSDYTVDTGF